MHDWRPFYMTLFPEKEDTTAKSHKAAAETFSDRVVALALSIPPGRVSTYGDIARAAGGGGMAARSVTGVLAKAWEAGQKNIPFHRIVYSDGRIWVSEEHRARRLKLYKQEGIEIEKGDRIKDFRDKLYEF
jgi:methylated-DNA-protein-cysteine methyltransferase-like protein